MVRAEPRDRARWERLLRSGARVSLWDCDAGAVGATAGELASLGEVHTATVDVTDVGQVDAATAGTAEWFGGIDILVANAGIAGPTVPTWEYPPEEWRRVLDIDLTGIFLCCRAVVPHMRRQKYGRIVNIASIAGKEGNPNASAYSAAKAGVIALTKSLGKELAGQDIAVNCITPAAAKTRIFEQITQAHIDYMLSKIRARGSSRVVERSTAPSRVARIGGELVRDWRRLRHERRPRDYLIGDEGWGGNGAGDRG